MGRFKNISFKMPQSALTLEDYQFHDRVANIAFLGNFLVVAFLFYLVFRNIDGLPPEVPLFLTHNWGVARLVAKTYLWFVPSTLLVVFFVNYAVALAVQKQYLLLARILGVVTLVMSLLAVYSVIRIVSLLVVPSFI